MTLCSIMQGLPLQTYIVIKGFQDSWRSDLSPQHINSVQFYLFI